MCHKGLWITATPVVRTDRQTQLWWEQFLGCYSHPAKPKASSEGGVYNFCESSFYWNQHKTYKKVQRVQPSSLGMTPLLPTPPLPVYLHNSSLCSCWLATTSTCLCWGCSTPPRPGCRNHHRLPPRRGDHSQHTPLKAEHRWWGRSQLIPHSTLLIHPQADPSTSIFIFYNIDHIHPEHTKCIKNHTQTTEPTTTERLIMVTCISSAHIHVCYLLPGVCPWVVDFHTLPHQGPVVAPGGVEQPTEHTNTCQAQPGQPQHRDRAAHPCFCSCPWPWPLQGTSKSMSHMCIMISSAPAHPVALQQPAQ